MNNEKLASLVGQSLISGEPVIAEEVASVLTDEELMQALQVRLAAGSLATATEIGVKAEPVDCPAPALDVAPMPAEPEMTTTAERVSALQLIMAKQFSTDKQLLKPEDFGSITVGDGDDSKQFVMLTTPNGLYRGSFRGVMDTSKKNQAAFTVGFDGLGIDTRPAMTWDLYLAFLNQFKAEHSDLPLPDSQAFSKANGKPWTATWLTGEPANRLQAHYARVYDDGPRRERNQPSRDWDFICIRPAVEVVPVAA